MLGEAVVIVMSGGDVGVAGLGGGVDIPQHNTLLTSQELSQDFGSNQLED